MPTTLTMMCRHVLRLENATAVRCIAEADESGLCPVHRGSTPPPASTPRPKRDLNAECAAVG